MLAGASVEESSRAVREGASAVNRRTFISFGATAAVLARTAWAQAGAKNVALYAAVGPVLTQYDVDVDALTLAPRGSVTLPANVQYAWPHVSRRVFYVATSSSAPGTGPTGTVHHVSAFRVDSASGALTPLGRPIPLPTRPIHVTTDIPSAHLLVAFNNPSALRIYRIDREGMLGEEVKQSATLDFGVYGHQVRVSPNNRLAILVARGNDSTDGRREDPGSLKVFQYRDGVLGEEASIAPDGGYGFGPRHLDFHPAKPWVYVSLERQSKMYVYRTEDDGLSPEALYKKETLANPGRIVSRQAAGTVHVHPNGRFLYGVNRADTTAPFDGRNVFIGGENTLAVYAIDQSSGEPTPIQHVDTQGIHCRTFHIDPSGRMLVAAHNVPVLVRDGAGVKVVPACLSVFRIGADGTLEFVRKYDVETRDQIMFWMGMVPL
jgi:6-phosphogluconolactonase (cycloisomerase 2 family)